MRGRSSSTTAIRSVFLPDESDPTHYEADPDYELSGGNRPLGDMPEYTLADCKKNPFWVAIAGYVYDLTDLQKFHPGGEDVIALAHGKDVTNIFMKEVAHSELAKEQMKQYVIGTLRDGEHTDPEDLKGLSQASERELDKMWCMQCGQTKKQDHCNITGICGKQPTTAALQDLLLWQIKGLAQYAHRLLAAGREIPEKMDLYRFVALATFKTLTNVDFVDDHFHEMSKKAAYFRGVLQKAHAGLVVDEALTTGPASFEFVDNREALLASAEKVGVRPRKKVADSDPDGFALQELTQYSLKGTLAYLDHALVVEQHSSDAGVKEWASEKEWDEAFTEVFRLLNNMSTPTPATAATLDDVLASGKLAVESMRLLDAGNHTFLGVPTPTDVPQTPVPGKAILISGHDMIDVLRLLEQTEGTGIDVYTHGELQPAHGYPNIHKHKHLKGNWGRAWYKQQTDFALFPGPIVLTSNCLLAPRAAYRDRLYSKLAAWPGIPYIEGTDFSSVIEHAKRCPPITQERIDSISPAIFGKSWPTGFGREFLLENAGLVVDAVKAGKIKHIYVFGGCDGWEPDRWYMRRAVQDIPAESLVLTLACTKYRFKNLDFGNVPGTDLPRLMDMGQCNDVYGAIVVANALAGALGTEVHDLPLHLVISWLEQKAACILCALLHLNFKNVRWGPTRPGWMTDNIEGVLADNFNLKRWDTENPLKDMQHLSTTTLR